jgi:hypothetical protein
MARLVATVRKGTKLAEELKTLKDPAKVKRIHIEQENRETQEVMAAGQEDPKKAAIAVAEIEEKTQAEAKVQRDLAMNKLDMFSSNSSSYKAQMAKTLADLLMMLDWPRGWTADVVVTDGRSINIKGHPFSTKEGILLIVCTPGGNVMHQGMLSTGEPALDYAGCYGLALQAENTIDHARGLLLQDTGQNGDEGGIVDSHGRKLGSNQKGTP